MKKTQHDYKKLYAFFNAVNARNDERIRQSDKETVLERESFKFSQNLYMDRIC
jgi:hypothetical protein